MWTPLFAARFGITDLSSLSVPQMVDHVQYLEAIMEAAAGGR